MAEADRGIATQQAQLEDVYQRWSTEFPSSESTRANVGLLLERIPGDQAAQEQLLVEVSGHLALIALEAETEAPLETYELLQQTVIKFAQEPPKPSANTEPEEPFDALFEAAFSAVQGGLAMKNPQPFLRGQVTSNLRSHPDKP